MKATTVGDTKAVAAAIIAGEAIHKLDLEIPQRVRALKK